MQAGTHTISIEWSGDVFQAGLIPEQFRAGFSEYMAYARTCSFEITPVSLLFHERVPFSIEMLLIGVMVNVYHQATLYVLECKSALCIIWIS